MKYIDERPFEQIVMERTLSNKYTSRIEELLEDISIDKESGFKLYKNNNRHTLYDNYLDMWKAQKKRTEEDIKKEEELFEKYCKKFEELGVVAALDDSDDDEEDEDDAEEFVHEKKEKPLQRNVNVKNTQTQRQQQAKERAALAKTLKNSMATSQQKLIDNQKKIEQLDVKINYYTQYQNASQRYIGAMRNLVLLYERNQDKEFLRKGLDFILEYTEMLMKRYVSPKSCVGEVGTLCESHYLPLHLENNCLKCM